MAEDNNTSVTERVIHIEAELEQLIKNQERFDGFKKALWGIGGALFIQALGIAVGYGGLKSQLEDINSFRQDTATVLNVLSDHGTELLAVRTELARIRERDDLMMEGFHELSSSLSDKTQDRYYRADAVREKAEMREWVLLKMREVIADHPRQLNH